MLVLLADRNLGFTTTSFSTTTIITTHDSDATKTLTHGSPGATHASPVYMPSSPIAAGNKVTTFITSTILFPDDITMELLFPPCIPSSVTVPPPPCNQILMFVVPSPFHYNSITFHHFIIQSFHLYSIYTNSNY